VKVIKSCENDNYEIQMTAKRKVKMHINSLQKYNFPDTDRERVNMMVISGDIEADEEGLITSLPDFPDSCSAGGPDSTYLNDWTIGEQLTADQRADLHSVLADYPDVFSDRPGCTNLIEHTIRLTDDTPCFQTPYRIPESLKDAVENELLEMVRNDIIQFDETTSYCSPLIVVKKKYGGIRLVNNFINMNSKTVNKQYMMNNLSDLVSRVAAARFVSRMDIKQAFFSYFNAGRKY